MCEDQEKDSNTKHIPANAKVLVDEALQGNIAALKGRLVLSPGSSVAGSGLEVLAILHSSYLLSLEQ
jgi:hypothetical protein